MRPAQFRRSSVLVSDSRGRDQLRNGSEGHSSFFTKPPANTQTPDSAQVAASQCTNLSQNFSTNSRFMPSFTRPPQLVLPLGAALAEALTRLQASGCSTPKRNLPPTVQSPPTPPVPNATPEVSRFFETSHPSRERLSTVDAFRRLPCRVPPPSSSLRLPIPGVSSEFPLATEETPHFCSSPKKTAASDAQEHDSLQSRVDAHAGPDLPPPLYPLDLSPSSWPPLGLARGECGKRTGATTVQAKQHTEGGEKKCDSLMNEAEEFQFTPFVEETTERRGDNHHPSPPVHPFPNPIHSPTSQTIRRETSQTCRIPTSSPFSPLEDLPSASDLSPLPRLPPGRLAVFILASDLRVGDLRQMEACLRAAQIPLTVFPDSMSLLCQLSECIFVEQTGALVVCSAHAALNGVSRSRLLELTEALPGAAALCAGFVCHSLSSSSCLPVEWVTEKMKSVRGGRRCKVVVKSVEEAMHFVCWANRGGRLDGVPLPWDRGGGSLSSLLWEVGVDLKEAELEDERRMRRRGVVMREEPVRGRGGAAQAVRGAMRNLPCGTVPFPSEPLTVFCSQEFLESLQFERRARPSPSGGETIPASSSSVAAHLRPFVQSLQSMLNLVGDVSAVAELVESLRRSQGQSRRREWIPPPPPDRFPPRPPPNLPGLPKGKNFVRPIPLPQGARFFQRRDRHGVRQTAGRGNQFGPSRLGRVSEITNKFPGHAQNFALPFQEPPRRLPHDAGLPSRAPPLPQQAQEMWGGRVLGGLPEKAPAVVRPFDVHRHFPPEASFCGGGRERGSFFDYEKRAACGNGETGHARNFIQGFQGHSRRAPSGSFGWGGSSAPPIRYAHNLEGHAQNLMQIGGEPVGPTTLQTRGVSQIPAAPAHSQCGALPQSPAQTTQARVERPPQPQPPPRFPHRLPTFLPSCPRPP
uniref:Uncharacterized protein n=1 Tax=Chromera velia CCMP2878 TaxID=1169474 RepID=A0A0G4GS16_9ALVE|eukprot:Cvel_5120.t1-p1 / transcript=Cvel_5120.t1 / gene=Cvel_5120 / organism=Chromera_velia_CCMP2878 / gene_product=hypothetical protein / transcript_product=hypothetical protein / location=Cvel_scaffold234:36232-40544(-) / protein_length=917 / sequence_SO=supercontig / SO=protein_coding / is_pseudo=false